MLQRLSFLVKLKKRFTIHPVCAILGPRQCGKTTLALQYAAETGVPTHHFDLENPRHWHALDNPLLALESLEGLIILDEIQRKPDIFPVIRYLVDHHQKQFLILGSASRDLIQQSSESLAGRISYLELTPFSLSEVRDIPHHLYRGGFPKSYLADTDEVARLWQEDYITAFLERDLAAIGINLNPFHMRQLWVLLAHYHGQLMNYSSLGEKLNLSHTTVKRYIEILHGTFMVRILKPWYENIGKRQVKSPKAYIRDSGLCHALLGIEKHQVLGHPKMGALWEGYALEEIIRYMDLRADSFYFWRSEHGAELDLFVEYKGKRLGFEFKYADTPTITKSMRVSLESLKLDTLFVVVPKTQGYPMRDKIIATDLFGVREFLAI
jgi:hypothetical protein